MVTDFVIIYEVRKLELRCLAIKLVNDLKRTYECSLVHRKTS